MTLFPKNIPHLTGWLLATLLVLHGPGPAAGEEALVEGHDFAAASLSLGYRAVSSRGERTRAGEYRDLQAGPISSAQLRGAEGKRHFHLDLDYRTDADFLASADLDYKGLLRLRLEREALFHQLDHLPYQDRPAATLPPGGVPADLVRFSDQDPGDRYHVEVNRTEARLRAKVPDFPAHVNLGYWRLERSGERQLRFLDEGCTGCHVQSRSRSIDRVTEEVSGGLDAHLGPVDVIFEQLYRQFRDRSAIPADSFGAHDNRLAGTYQHDEAPDSSLSSTSVKLHTSLAGGLVGAASFTAGERKNRSDLADVGPVESETDFRKAAGDLTLIPSPSWTISFRYRLLDLDNQTPDRLGSSGAQFTVYPPPAFLPVSSPRSPDPVRENPDLRRAVYQSSLSWRPLRAVTLKGEFQREEIRRGTTGGPVEETLFGEPTFSIDPVWELPEEEHVNRVRVSLFARPLDKGRLKVNAWVQLQRSDDPAYGASVEEGEQGFAGMTWTPSPKGGLHAGLKAEKTRNNSYRLFQQDGGSFRRFDLDRRSESQNFTAGGWANPARALTLTLNYGFLRTRTLQDLLFGDEPGAGFSLEDEGVEYSQRVQTVSASAAWTIREHLRGMVEGRYIRSFSQFAPGVAADNLTFALDSTTTYLADADGTLLRELSQVEIRQAGISAGLAWAPPQGWGWSLQYTWDDYRDRNEDWLEGTVQTTMASISRSW